MTDEPIDKAGAKPCPICGKPPVTRYRPFCSSRCADVDLHRWLSGSYSIPGDAAEDEDGEEIPLAPRPPKAR
ncbi:DNA gyrase inhibitor YacG [Ancylobacter sp. 3268]|uniref:DNA gyrase inhibitor YacG n=1 Tax=Ancylobacter sp. 3268 TaxID=2817752 RepID=UPI00286D5CDC|nr:DNA gyrase inhibitor YacG [Ancylobacter sp. 3268]